MLLLETFDFVCFYFLLQVHEDKEAAGFLKKLQSQKTPEDVRIFEMLQQLKKHSNKVAALRDFEEWFFDLRPKLSAEQLKLLFLGDESYSGFDIFFTVFLFRLLAACGSFDYSDIASRAALELLCRLLDVEKNKDAALFLDFFCHLDRHYLKILQLHLHCLRQHGSRQGAFAIVQILKERVPQLPLEHYLQDSLARQEYFRWLENRTDSSHSLNLQENQVKSLVLKDINYKAVVEQSVFDIIKNVQMEQGWRVVSCEKEKGYQLTYRKEFNKDVV